MKCNNCSTENKDDAKFCCNCGCKLATSIFPDFIERMASVPKFPIFSSGKLIITPTQLIFRPYSINFGITTAEQNLTNNTMRSIFKNLFIIPVALCFTVCAFAQNNEMTVTDCQGNIYPVVKIGEQYWMAENLRCTKYDTESERSGKMLEVPEYCDSGNPYYIEVVPYYDWGLLDISQIRGCGNLYNWTAAVGLKSKRAALKEENEFKTRRQGICPNGWHIPTKKEWETLINYVSIHSDNESVAKKLMSTTGWKRHRNGTDTYGFNAIPISGCTAGNCDSGIGNEARFISATSKNSFQSYYAGLENSYYEAYTFYSDKSSAFSVRCVKN